MWHWSGLPSVKALVAKLHPLNPSVPCMHLTSPALSLSLTLLVLLLAHAFVSRRSRTVGFQYSESCDKVLVPSHSVTWSVFILNHPHVL